MKIKVEFIIDRNVEKEEEILKLIGISQEFLDRNKEKENKIFLETTEKTIRESIETENLSKIENLRINIVEE